MASRNNKNVRLLAEWRLAKIDGHIVLCHLVADERCQSLMMKQEHIGVEQVFVRCLRRSVILILLNK